MGARALDATHARRGRGGQPDQPATHLRHVHASLVTQSDSRSRATLARPPRRENEAARNVSVRAVQPAQGERHRLVAASTLSVLPGRRVGEQAVLASRRRPARSLTRRSAPADGALRSRHEVGTRAGTPLDFGAAASTTLERSAGTGSHGAKPTRERRRSCATTSRRRRAGCARLRASSAASRGPRWRVHALKRHVQVRVVVVGGG